MQFLADESCDFGVVLALRAAGHDVVAIAEVSPREEDDSHREREITGLSFHPSLKYHSVIWQSGFSSLKPLFISS